MSNRPSWSCPVDSGVLLLLAWFCTLDVRARLQRKKREQSWKMFPVLLEDLLQASLEEALSCLQADSTYGPAWLHLARYCIARVDLQRVTWAIALEELADPSNGVFFSDDPYRPAVPGGQQTSGPANETEAFLSAMKLHTPLAERLQGLSQKWEGDVCLGAFQLQTLLTWNLEIMQGRLRVPFFLLELLRTSLERIDWHTIAEQVLHVALPSLCHCSGTDGQGGALTLESIRLLDAKADTIAAWPGPESLLQRAVNTISALLMNLADAEDHRNPVTGEIYDDVVQGALFLAEALKGRIVPGNYGTDGVAELIEEVIGQVAREQSVMRHEKETGGE